MRFFFKIFQYIYWDLQLKQGRYEYINYILGNLPGHLGLLLREKIIVSYFNKHGTNIKLFPGIYIRGINNLSVGNNVEIGPNCLMNANGLIEIGNDVLIGPNSKIWSVNHQFSDTGRPISSQGFVDKKVTIGDGCWLGANVIVLPGATIMEGVIVAAGTVIPSKTIDPFTIVGGNPCQVIRNRDKV